MVAEWQEYGARVVLLFLLFFLFLECFSVLFSFVTIDFCPLAGISGISINRQLLQLSFKILQNAFITEH